MRREPAAAGALWCAQRGLLPELSRVLLSERIEARPCRARIGDDLRRRSGVRSGASAFDREDFVCTRRVCKIVTQEAETSADRGQTACDAIGCRRECAILSSTRIEESVGLLRSIARDEKPRLQARPTFFALFARMLAVRSNRGVRVARCNSGDEEPMTHAKASRAQPCLSTGASSSRTSSHAARERIQIWRFGVIAPRGRSVPRRTEYGRASPETVVA